MDIDNKTIIHIARLARIGIDESRIDRMRDEFRAIVEFIDQLKEVDVAHVSPADSVMGEAMRLRADEVNEGGCADDIVANAPEHRDDFFVVPRVIE